MRFHQSGAEGQNRFPRPVGHTAFDAAQDIVVILDCKCTLLRYVQLLVNQHPHILLLRAALKLFSVQPVFALELTLNDVQNIALSLVELHEVRMGSPLKPVRVALDSIPSLQCVNCTTKLGVIRKLTEGALNPTVHVPDKDVKQYSSQYGPLRNATRHWSPPGH